MAEPVRTGVTTETAWMQAGSCHGQPLALFYPDPPLHTGIGLDAAKLCYQCPVQAECLNWALVRDEWGTWGGTSVQDRKALRRGIVRKMCPACGNRRPQGDGETQVCMACGLSWTVRQRRANTEPESPR
jgi:WhiB family transcriptional regulator, redox-sensing transcriptional regulator